jgi:hypothetical protein
MRAAGRNPAALQDGSIEALERDRDPLLESYAGMALEALDTPSRPKSAAGSARCY